MNRESVVIVLDCGATNLRSIAVESSGDLLAQASRPNETVPQPGDPGMGIWDLEVVWAKLCAATREVLGRTGNARVEGVIAATWGADGAPMSRDGSLTYPIISWQCSRTEGIAGEFSEMNDPWRIYRITGYQVMAINTLFKFMWLRENSPDSLDGANCWLMMPGLVESKLGARDHVDPTSASTTMAMDLGKMVWSEELLGIAGLGPDFFPEWRYPGEVVGEVSRKASGESGLPEGTPILAGGHDTQFALVGSGAGRREAILSSGTWEILAQRSNSFEPTRDAFEGGLIFEVDASRGLFDPQILMMGSGVLEWVQSTFFPDVQRGRYETMIELGGGVPAGSRGVRVLPSFVRDSGPSRRYGTRGTILGLQLGTRREDIYRAAIEGLSFQLRNALEVLSESTGNMPKSIRVVGGGSKNGLWNQIRADVTGLPVKTTSHKEATVIGAALVAFAGAGRFDSVESAAGEMDFSTTTFEPGPDREVYREEYFRYLKLPPALEPAYSQRD